MANTLELTVKDQYQDCKLFKCPRFLALCDVNVESGKPSFSEGSSAYSAAVLCNNWAIGLSDGECVVSPTVLEEAH